MSNATSRTNTKAQTLTASAYTTKTDSNEAGEDIALQIKKALKGKQADVIIVFASSGYNYDQLLGSIKNTASPKILTGCSSAGEFTNTLRGEGSVSAVAITSKDMHFNLVVGKDLSKGTASVAKRITDKFEGAADDSYPYRSALLLADALAGFTDDFVDQMNQCTGGAYQYFGGGAGDDAKFNATHVFNGSAPLTDAVVALEILSKKPIGVGVRHGWMPSGTLMRVTETEGMSLKSLDAIPAVKVIKDYAAKTNQSFDENDPMPFFLHNVLGIKTASGYKLRVPLGVGERGQILCASDIPQGSLVSFMKTSAQSAADAAREAAEDAILQLEGNPSEVALVFDCVATRLRTGVQFDTELEYVSEVLQGAKFVGCNTYGQISRVDGQFSGFHNCTAVVCVFPS